jgi:hypothetical protein
VILGDIVGSTPAVRKFFLRLINAWNMHVDWFGLIPVLVRPSPSKSKNLLGESETVRADEPQMFGLRTDSARTLVECYTGTQAKLACCQSVRNYSDSAQFRTESARSPRSPCGVRTEYVGECKDLQQGEKECIFLHEIHPMQ